MEKTLNKHSVIVKDAMYSRLGKAIKLQQRLVINNGSPSKYSKGKPHKAKSTSNAYVKSKLVVHARQSRMRPTSSFIAVDRNHTPSAYNSSTKERSPCTGHYHPTYKLVEPTVKVFGFGSPSKRSTNTALLEKYRRKTRNLSTLNRTFHGFPKDYLGTNSVVKTGISFKYQVGRDQIKTPGSPFGSPGAHEARFSYLSQPCKVLGSHHEYSSPDFSKTKPRDNAMYRKNMTLTNYSSSQPGYLGTLRAGAIDFSKTMPRPSTAQSRSFTIPDPYPLEDIDKGYGVLGHIKRVQSPSMEKMMARDNKMYYINESANLDPPKELTKLKSLFTSTIGGSLRSMTPTMSPTKTIGKT